MVVEGAAEAEALRATGANAVAAAVAEEISEEPAPAGAVAYRGAVVEAASRAPILG